MRKFATGDVRKAVNISLDVLKGILLWWSISNREIRGKNCCLHDSDGLYLHVYSLSENGEHLHDNSNSKSKCRQIEIHYRFLKFDRESMGFSTTRELIK